MAAEQQTTGLLGAHDGDPTSAVTWGPIFLTPASGDFMRAAGTKGPAKKFCATRQTTYAGLFPRGASPPLRRKHHGIAAGIP